MKDPLLVPGSFYEKWRFKITPASRYLSWGLLLAGIGTVTVLIPVYQTFCALAALLLAAWIAGWLMRPRVKVVGSLPVKTTAGLTATGEFIVTNVSRFPAFDLAIGIFELPDELAQPARDRTVAELSGGESATIPLTIQTHKRGLYPLPDLRIYSLFPFLLVRSGSARHPLGAILVLPAFHTIAGIDVPVGNRYQPGGISLTSHIGESPEYIGNREYVPGEPARRLDFRSWARLGKPVVREFQEEYYCRIALILDTYVPKGRKAKRTGFDNLEAAISLAASIADALADGEYIIDLFAAGPELYVFRAGRHTAHLENVLEILACVDVCRDDPFQKIAPAVSDELGNISAVICVFLDWDESRRMLAREVLEAGCSLKTFIVRNGETTDTVDPADAGDWRPLTPDAIRSGGLDVL